MEKRNFKILREIISPENVQYIVFVLPVKPIAQRFMLNGGLYVFLLRLIMPSGRPDLFNRSF